MGYIAVPNVFVEDVPNDLTFFNSEPDVYLDGYTSMTLVYTPKGGTEVTWADLPITPVYSGDVEGQRHIKAAIVRFTPVVSQFRFFNKLFILFKQLILAKKALAGTSSGTMTGTMNPDDKRPAPGDPPGFTNLPVTFYDPS